MKFNSLKETLIALGIIIVATIIFCLPVFQGKVLNSHDYVSWRYMSEESRKVSAEQNSYAFWTNSQFGGLPSFNTYGTKHGNLFATLQFIYIADAIPRPVFLLLMAGIMVFILGCSLGLSTWVSLFGALAFEFSSYNPILTYAGHDTKLLTMAYGAGVLAGMFYMVRKRLWTGMAVYTLSMALMWTSGHYQIVYYMLIVIGIFSIFLLIRYRKTLTLNYLMLMFGLMIAGGIIGALPSAQSVLLVKDYTKETMRGGNTDLTIQNKQENAGKKKEEKRSGLDIEYAYRWSQGIGETFSLVVPNVNGPIGRSYYEEGETADKLGEIGLNAQLAQQLPDYWGPQPFVSGPVYFGVLVVFLFIFGLFQVKSDHKWWIAGASLLFIMLSWGRNFPVLNNMLFEYLPYYNKFRTPSMSLVIPQLLFPLLGMWCLHELTKKELDKKAAFQNFKYSAIITAALVLLGGVLSFIWQDYNGEAIQQLKEQLASSFQNQPEAVNSLLSAMRTDMAEAVRKDGMRSLVVLLLGSGLIYAYLKNKLSGYIMVLAILFISTVELIMVDKRYEIEDNTYLDKDEYEDRMFGPRKVDTEIMSQAGNDPHYRVQDLSVNTYNDAKPAYFHKLVGGYHPAKMQRYQELIDLQLSKQNSAVYNMLNTRFFILPPQGQQGGEPMVYPNANACGNGWFVKEIKVVNNSDEEMLALNARGMFGDTSSAEGFNPKQTAILQKEFQKNIPTLNYNVDSGANIKLLSYGLNDLSFESNNNNNGFAVFSDIYYSGGWTCTIDDKPAPIVRTNYVLRGVSIPAGKHNIKFNFNPPNADLGRNLARVGSVLILLLVAFGFWKGRDEEGKESITPEQSA